MNPHGNDKKRPTLSTENPKTSLIYFGKSAANVTQTQSLPIWQCENKHFNRRNHDMSFDFLKIHLINLLDWEWALLLAGFWKYFSMALEVSQFGASVGPFFLWGSWALFLLWMDATLDLCNRAASEVQWYLLPHYIVWSSICIVEKTYEDNEPNHTNDGPEIESHWPWLTRQD